MFMPAGAAAAAIGRAGCITTFAWKIPEKQYGAGKVIIWDKGVWIPLQDPRKAVLCRRGPRDKNGRLKFLSSSHFIFPASG